MDGAGHAPMVGAAPTRAVESVITGLLGDPTELRPLTWIYVHRWNIDAADGKSVYHIIAA